MVRRQFVIVGNGITGITAAETLRAADPACAITMIADDPSPVYYRPALKDFLGGRLSVEKLWARPTTFYRDQQIRFVPGLVQALDSHRHLLRLPIGTQPGYQRLLLANGSRRRALSGP